MWGHGVFWIDFCILDCKLWKFDFFFVHKCISLFPLTDAHRPAHYAPDQRPWIIIRKTSPQRCQPFCMEKLHQHVPLEDRTKWWKDQNCGDGRKLISHRSDLGHGPNCFPPFWYQQYDDKLKSINIVCILYHYFCIRWLDMYVEIMWESIDEDVIVSLFF